MNLYHKTTAEVASAILRKGLRDGSGFYLTDTLHEGVWLSNSPLDGRGGESLLECTFGGSETEITDFEWIEEGKGYREWLIPAANFIP